MRGQRECGWQEATLRGNGGTAVRPPHSRASDVCLPTLGTHEGPGQDGRDTGKVSTWRYVMQALVVPIVVICAPHQCLQVVLPCLESFSTTLTLYSP